MKYVVVSSTAIRTADVIKDLSEGYQPKQVIGALLFIVADLDCTAITQSFDNVFAYAGCTMVAGFSRSHSDRQSKFSETAIMVLFFGDDELASGYISSFPHDQKRLLAFSSNDHQVSDYQKKFNLLGGIAAKGYDGRSSAVWANGLYTESGTVAIDLPTSTVGIVKGSGWLPMDDIALLVNDANGHVIKQLNGLPAAHVYRTYIDNPVLSGLYPLMGHGSQLLDVISVNEEEGYLTLNQPITEGEVVKVCACSRTDLVVGVKAITAQPYVNSGDEQPLLNIAFSCSSRHFLLGDMVHSEFDLLESYKPNSEQSNIIVYLAGQFIPDFAGTTLASQTLVISSLFDNTSDRLSDL